MNPTRRTFLSEVGKGMFVASLGVSVATDLGLSSVSAADGARALDFGDFEPLVCLMQDTPVDAIQRVLLGRISQGEDIQRLVVAGALANARTFGGQDYNGYHTFMALSPAWEMSKLLPENERLLPIFKVLYRNTNRIQEHGGHSSEILHALEHLVEHEPASGSVLQAASRKADFDLAESVFSDACEGSISEAFHILQYAVQDEVDVHRTVLAWRAWSMIDLAGLQFAHPLLRQSVRYCVDSEQALHRNNRSPSSIRQLLPVLLSDFRLLDRQPGTRIASDSELDELSRLIHRGSREEAARTMAAALADGLSIDSASEALSLASVSLLLRDPGRTEQQASPDKPQGSVHGASVGVHACDSANAWRNIAEVCDPRNQFASMIVGAFHTAGQAGNVAGEDIPFVDESQLLGQQGDLLSMLDEAITQKNQLQASAVAYRYLQSGKPVDALTRKLLKFAVSQEGALHAEKYFMTATQEYAKTRHSLAWRHLVALARVTASEYGFPAAGQEEARQLLQLT